MESEKRKHVENGDVQETKYQVVPVNLEETFKNISHGKGKYRYYKQTYRPAWERMPDFDGWLKGVKGKPTRAFCTYCHKTLHAHRLSLLKHASTMKHLKAEHIYCTKEQNRTGKEKLVNQKVATNEDELMGENEKLESSDMEDGETEHENDEDEGENWDEAPVKFQMIKKESVQKTNVTELPPISTQVTDLSKGRPLSGLQVSLYKLIDGKWTYMNEGITNASGSFSQFLERCDFMPGRYKLHYDVDRHFESKKQKAVFPFIEIVFDCATFSDSHHIPLLLGPYGYTIYKG